ncbi:hypothetical protein MNBD_ALPHA12-1460 [hydrothermal vent metagenome]|uniref:Flagellar protein FlbB n=1 Tax=hydrothermal vent metagenome TaxID=652676 RepID=A0A3B0UU48_9ZZZZ
MNSIRLLPIVLVAISALLVFKTIGLVTQGGYVLLGTNQAMAQAQPDAQPGANAPDAAALSPSEEAAAARAAESLFASPNPASPAAPGDKTAATTPDGAAATDAKAPDQGSQAKLSPTEEAVLQRLSERRIELDDRANKLDLQASLVKAAEERLNQRIEELKTLEARVQALVDMQNAQGDKAFASLVSMYENMKPNDAAAVFNTLDMNVLLRLALRMNPRKMSPILAKMNTERAQLLTVRMASPQVNGSDMNALNNTAPPASSALPQIVGK